MCVVFTMETVINFNENNYEYHRNIDKRWNSIATEKANFKQDGSTQA